MPSSRTLFRVLNPIPHIRASSLSSEQRKEEVHLQVWGSRACSQDGDAAESVGKVRWWWSPKDNLGYSCSFVWSQSALGSHQDSDRMKALPSISLQSVLSVSCVWGNVWNTVLALGAGSINLQQVPWAQSEGLRRWGVHALYLKQAFVSELSLWFAYGMPLRGSSVRMPCHQLLLLFGRWRLLEEVSHRDDVPFPVWSLRPVKIWGRGVSASPSTMPSPYHAPHHIMSCFSSNYGQNKPLPT